MLTSPLSRLRGLGVTRFPVELKLRSLANSESSSEFVFGRTREKSGSSGGGGENWFEPVLKCNL